MCKNNSSHKQIAYWLLTGSILVFCMIIIGGITRLTGSGLSIVEWDLIMGIIPPFTEAEWVSAFNKYKQFPQFRMINYEMTVSEFKSIFWWEYIHRFWGRMLGLIFIIPFFYFLIKKKISKILLKKLLILFFLGALQGLIGWWMVKSGLINKPHVSAYRLTTHLILAVMVFSYSLWLALHLLNLEPLKYSGLGTIKRLSIIIISTIYLQIIYGGLMAGLKAGLFYPTFPKIKGQWFPDGMWVIEPFWKNFFENITTVHFFHRTLGILILFLIIFLWIMVYKNLVLSNLKLIINIIPILAVVQVALGITTLIFGMPFFTAILHQIFAMILLAVMILFIFRIKYSDR